MKFMKLGSKPDSFQTNGNDIRYVATELATDFIVNVGDSKFYLHKFPLLSRSARLQKMVAITSQEIDDEVHILDIPGGPSAFEICAKFCYGMAITLNAYNVVVVRCAAEYLEMHETVEKGNLIYKIEVFLNSIFGGWKDSIIVLQTTRFLPPWPEDLKITTRCIDSIASKASIDPSKVDWSYTYNRKKLPSEHGMDPHWNGVRKQQSVPKDWWVEDLCALEIDFYKRLILTIKSKGRISSEVIGEALKAYASRRLPSSGKGKINGGDVVRNQSLVETIIWLLPVEKGSVSCSFLLKLLKLASLLEIGETSKRELVKRIGQQLEDASVADLLISAPAGESLAYDIDLVRAILEEFVVQEQCTRTCESMDGELVGSRTLASVSYASKLAVANLVDGYLAEIARDSHLPLSKFVELAEMVSDVVRPVHDGLYRAIDMYLKEHPGLSKGEKKRICRLMDCKKLSMDACMHAAQNERLPLRVVVQVLFFEQVRAAMASGGCPPSDLPGSIHALLPQENGGSHGSSRSVTTHTEEDSDAGPTTEELKCLKGELAAMRLGGESNGVVSGGGVEVKNAEKLSKVKGLVKSKKILNKLWSSKGQLDNSSSDTSDSPSDSVNPPDTKSTPSRNSRRHSIS